MPDVEAKTVEVWHNQTVVRFAALRVQSAVYLIRLPDRWAAVIWHHAALERTLDWIADHFAELRDGDAIDMDEVPRRPDSP
jgi:hypothetical protein